MKEEEEEPNLRLQTQSPAAPRSHTQLHVYIQKLSVRHIMSAQFICTARSVSSEVAPQKQMYKLRR